MITAATHELERYTTSSLAAASGYSVQQIRDLDRLGVIPPAIRKPNRYRQFTGAHATALRVYRHCTTAVGPVQARATMREMRQLPSDEAIACIVALHVGLARDRDDTTAALHALESVVEESAHDAPSEPSDSMSITELSVAIGARSSAHSEIPQTRARPCRTGCRASQPDPGHYFVPAQTWPTCWAN